MKKLLALLLAFCMVISLAACFGPTEEPTPTTTDPVDIPEELRYGGHLNFVVNGKPQNLDAAGSTGVHRYHWTNLIYETPLTRDADGKIRPNVCDFELSEDQLTLKLWVREGVTFHDGSLVEIEDVIASIKRTVHKSPKQYVAPFIKNVEIDDKGVATITFTEYSEKTIQYIASPTVILGVMPKEICEQYSASKIVKIEDAIGTGPYKVVDFETNVSVDVVRHEGYVAVPEGYTGMASPKKAYLDSITVINDSNTNSFNIGMLDGSYGLRTSAGADFRDRFIAAGMNEFKQRSSTGAMFRFNTFGNGIVSGDNNNMRKAILAAIDIPEFLSLLSGVNPPDYYPASGIPVYDGIYYTDVFEKADYMGADNKELSKQYQAAAGYNGEPLKIVIVSDVVPEFTYICNYLAAAGINFDMEVMEKTAQNEFISKPENAWDILFTYPTFAATPGQLSSAIMKDYYKGEEKDRLFAELQKLPAGSDAYIAKWHELAEQMVDDCSVAFVQNVELTWWSHPDLVFSYEGANSYVFNAYWKNPSEHTK